LAATAAAVAWVTVVSPSFLWSRMLPWQAGSNRSNERHSDCSGAATATEVMLLPDTEAFTARRRFCGATAAGAARVALVAAAAVVLAATKKGREVQMRLASKEEEAKMLEAALLKLFEYDEPDIFKVRDILSRLARLSKKPNAQIFGDWMIFWASARGCVDKVFGTGVTFKDQWVTLQEYLLRLSTKKEGRLVEAAEVLRRVGPFPNEHNIMKGVYAVSGTTTLRITFDDIKTQSDKKLELPDGATEKIIDLNVIYSSKGILAMQYTDEESGECDFFVCTPVDDMQTELKKLLGLDRRRFLFN